MKLLYDSVTPLLGIHPKEKKIYVYPKTCKWTFLIIHNSQKMETTQMPTNGWINKMWYIHTTEYEAVLKRNEVLIHASLWTWNHHAKWKTAAAAVKLLQSCPTLCDPRDAAHQVPPSLGFSRQEHWSGLPFPSPMHESEKWKWSRSVVSLRDPIDCSPPGSSAHGIFQARVLECHCLLWLSKEDRYKKPLV